MNVDMTKNLTYASCTTNGGTAIAVKKRGSGAESFSGGLDHEYRVQIGLETWGDNNARGDNEVDIKVDNKVDNNARGDIKVDIKVDNKVDNNVWDDTVNRSRIDQETTDDTVKHPQTRTRTTTPYNIRTRSVQHPYKSQRCLWGEVIRGGVLKHSPLMNSLNEKVHETFAAAHNFVAHMHGGEAA